MPNWCNNYLTIKGDKNKINLINNLVKESNYNNIFLNLVGLEKGMTPADYENKWYDSNVNYWGCKWDVSINSCDWEFNEDIITSSFETAWSPPIGFCQKLAEIYQVEVHISYEECGVGFCGETYSHPDGTQEDNEYPYEEGLYKTQNDYFWEGYMESTMEWLVEENRDDESFDIVEYVNEHYHFCTEREREDIVKDYKSNIENE